jgi:hypothetical protein
MYIASHGDFRLVLNEVMSQILEVKPLNPVAHMKYYFLEKKRQSEGENGDEESNKGRDVQAQYCLW